jgi:hypothetical protein
LATHLDQNLTNIHWIVTSSDRKTPHLTYDVKYDYSVDCVDCLTCKCPHYQLRSEYCEHCISVLLFEGKGLQLDMASKQTYVCYVCRKNGFDSVRVYLDGFRLSMNASYGWRSKEAE